MYLQKLKDFFLPAVLPVLFMTACGEMDTILPSSVTYQIGAVVGRSSLDDYSIVGKDDAVQPVFMDSVLNDPDLTGLLVYLRGSERETVGEKVYYLLETAEKTDPGPPQSPAKGSDQNPAREQIRSPEQGAEAAEDLPGEEPEETRKETPDLPKEGEIFISVPRLDKGLPAFPFPENLKIGIYSLVFEALGEKQTLYRTERRFYYIGDAEFILGDIQSYLPGVSAGSYLIPPGFTVMLETWVTADERLDPYIVWYDGKRRITGGRIADGNSRLLWEVPAQTGFHTIRAEVFPFKPAGTVSETGNSRTGRSSVSELRGKVKELVLPVSARGGKSGFFVPGAGEPLYWYQFAGNLRDSMTPDGRERNLIGGGQDLRWVPSDGIYGLSVKSGDIYQAPRSSFTLDGDQGGGRFLLRVKPVTEGTLLTASFNAADSSGNALTMSIAYRDQSLQLSLEFEGQKALGSLPLDMLLEDPAASPEYPEVKNFVTLEAGFYVRGNTFIAALHREGDAGFGEKTLLPGEFQVDSSAGFSSHGSPAGHLTMELSGPLSGEINCRLGTREQAPQPARGNRNLTSEKAAGETASPGQLTLVSAGETAPAEPSAEVPAASSAGRRAVPSRDSPQTEPYPLAIFDEFAIILEPSAR